MIYAIAMGRGIAISLNTSGIVSVEHDSAFTGCTFRISDRRIGTECAIGGVQLMVLSGFMFVSGKSTCLR